MANVVCFAAFTWLEGGRRLGKTTYPPLDRESSDSTGLKRSALVYLNAFLHNKIMHSNSPFTYINKWSGRWCSLQCFKLFIFTQRHIYIL